MTVTWCPTCSARLTPESATSLSSLVLPDERLEVAVALDESGGGVLCDGLPAGGAPACGLSLPGLLDVLDMLLDPVLNLAFFSTKLPPAALLGLALASVLDDPPARCRQPVALVEPAAWPVDGCGVDAVGLCAASVPHNTTALLSVTAHCH
jgi:hypothetical protein